MTVVQCIMLNWGALQSKIPDEEEGIDCFFLHLLANYWLDTSIIIPHFKQMNKM
jgi:hypothetical protein